MFSRKVLSIKTQLRAIRFKRNFSYDINSNRNALKESLEKDFPNSARSKIPPSGYKEKRQYQPPFTRLVNIFRGRKDNQGLDDKLVEGSQKTSNVGGDGGVDDEVSQKPEETKTKQSLESKPPLQLFSFRFRSIPMAMKTVVLFAMLFPSAISFGFYWGTFIDPNAFMLLQVAYTTSVFACYGGSYLGALIYLPQGTMIQQPQVVVAAFDPIVTAKEANIEAQARASKFFIALVGAMTALITCGVIMQTIEEGMLTVIVSFISLIFFDFFAASRGWLPYWQPAVSFWLTICLTFNLLSAIAGYIDKAKKYQSNRDIFAEKMIKFKGFNFDDKEK